MKYILAFLLVFLVASAVAQQPGYVSGFCSTTPSLIKSVPGSGHVIFLATNGASGCAGSTGTIGLDTTAPTTGWACTAIDVTAPDSWVIQETTSTKNTVTFKVYSRTTGAPGTWAPSDHILFDCQDF